MIVTTTSGAARQLRSLPSEDAACVLDAVATCPLEGAVSLYCGMFRLNIDTSLGPLVLLYTETGTRRLLLSARLAKPP